MHKDLGHTVDLTGFVGTINYDFIGIFLSKGNETSQGSVHVQTSRNFTFLVHNRVYHFLENVVTVLPRCLP